MTFWTVSLYNLGQTNMEGPLTQETVTLVVAGFGIAGTFGGVFLGQSMSQSWQREQWLRDHRIQEFRELLDALADSLRVSMTMHAGALMEDQQRDIVKTHSNAMRVIRSRIFTMDFVHESQIEIRWVEASMQHSRDHNVAALAIVFNILQQKIVAAAYEDHKRLSHLASIKSHLFRLLPWKRKKTAVNFS
jgi:hypothetical protein